MLGKSILDLSISNPTKVELALPDPFAIHQLRSDGYSPQASGSKEVLESISEYYRQEFHANVPADQLLLTSSTSEAYSYCFKLIADPGDSILIPQPSYPLLQMLVEAESLEGRHYPFHRVGSDWLLDRERLGQLCDNTTRAIVLVNPNSPTGHFLPEEDLNWLIDFSRDRYWLISDEVFSDYVWSNPGPDTRSLTQFQTQNAFVLSGLSKICALPQMKLAWIAMPSDPKLHQNLELVADTYLSVTTPIQSAATGWLAERQNFQAPVRDRCRANLELLQNSLRNTPWSLNQPEAGWVAILHGPSHIEEEDFALRLLAEGVSIQPGYFYDLPIQPCFVISLLTQVDHLRAGLRIILSA